MVHIRIACSSCRRPVCGKVTIYLRNGKGNGEIFFEGGGKGNVKWMVYEVIAIVAIVAIVAISNSSNKGFSSR